MKTAPLLTLKSAVVGSVLALMPLCIAGCAEGAADEPLTPDMARDLLVENVNGAANVIGVAPTGSHPRAQQCESSLGDGVQFSYAISVPGERGTTETLESVAAYWSSNGLRVQVDEGKVSQRGEGVTPEDSPVLSIIAAHTGKFEILGYSHCVPGDALEYITLTGEQELASNEWLKHPLSDPPQGRD